MAAGPGDSSKAQIIGFSDGGLPRSVKKAAVSWVVEEIAEEGVWLLGKGGQNVDCGSGGSFMVEALALECLVEKFVSLSCLDLGVLDDTWMVSPVEFSLEQEAVTRTC